MPIMFIDIATTDNWHFDDKDPQSTTQARMIRLTHLLVTERGDTLSDLGHLILKEEGAPSIMPEAMENHGITEAMLSLYGLSMEGVLKEFWEAIAKTDLIVAHSWQWQRKALEWSCAHHGIGLHAWPPVFDTMIKGAAFVGISKQQPGGGYRWPKFTEMYEKLYGLRWEISNPLGDGFRRAQMVRLAYDRLTQQSV